MGVRILTNEMGDMACLYCSTSDWTLGPVFYGEREPLDLAAGEVAEEFCDWFTDGGAAAAAAVLGLRSLLGDGHDPREWDTGDLERLYQHWRTERRPRLEVLAAYDAAPDDSDGFLYCHACGRYSVWEPKRYGCCPACGSGDTGRSFPGHDSWPSRREVEDSFRAKASA